MPAATSAPKMAAQGSAANSDRPLNTEQRDLTARLAAERVAVAAARQLCMEQHPDGSPPCTVSRETLCQLAPAMQAQHYQEAVEERAISLRCCGYPRCSNPLPQSPSKGRYRIDTSRKVVVDITELKRFCSRQCYASSKHYQAQLSEIPVGLRSPDVPLKPVTLAEDIMPNSSPPRQPDQRPRPDGLARVGSGSLVIKERTPAATPQPPSADGVRRGPHDLEGYRTGAPDAAAAVASTKGKQQEPTQAQPRSEAPRAQAQRPTRHPVAPSRPVDPFELRKLAMAEAKSEEQPLEAMGRRWTSEDATSAAPAVNAPRRASTSRQAKETPVFDALAVLASWRTDRTNAYLRGEEAPRKSLAETAEPVLPPGVVLPPIDSRAQTSMRRNILWQQLEQSVCTFAAELGVARGVVGDEIRALIATFDLHNVSIAFKPAQGALLAYALVAAVSQRVPALAEALSTSTEGVPRPASVTLDRLARQSVSEDVVDALAGAFAQTL
eukprot:m.110935 g.110935  ORF g.110935 m.110935 type:complete len:496 (+) comp16090_c1_seq1:460-1947(+)